MRVTEQTPDQLRIVGRTPNPFVRTIITAGALFTVPILIALVVSPTHDRIAGSVVFLGFLWFLLGIAYAASGGLSAPPIAVFDAKKRQSDIGGSIVSFDRIKGVRGRSPGLIVDLGHGDSAEFSSDSTPPEMSAAERAITDFLRAHRVRFFVEEVDVEEDDEAGETLADGEEPEDADELGDFDHQREAARRWATKWEEPSMAARRCFYCGTRQGGEAPVQLRAKHERLALDQLLYVPRCKHCATVHMHGRVIPGSAAALSFFATFVFCVAVLSERMEEGFAFGAAFIALVITVPIAMLLLASFLTNPNWFGSRPVETWEEQPDLAKAGRRGWTIQQSP